MHASERPCPRPPPLVLAAALAGCAGWGGGGGGAGGANSINVLMVNNPQMIDLQRLTADNFTRQTGIDGQLHRAAGERRPRQDQPGVLQPGRPVRRRLAEQLRDPDLRKSQVDRAAGRLRRRRHRVQPGRHPAADDPVADRRRRQALRRAVLRRVVVPDVPQGRAGRRRASRCRRTRPGSRSPTSPPRWTASSPGCRHLPARPARLGPGLRAADHGGEHLRRHLVREGLDAEGQRARVHARPPSSTWTWSGRTARSAPRRPASPSA